jgi:hypothetical protein
MTAGHPCHIPGSAAWPRLLPLNELPRKRRPEERARLICRRDNDFPLMRANDVPDHEQAETNAALLVGDTCSTRHGLEEHGQERWSDGAPKL